jgi:hypothetical protein
MMTRAEIPGFVLADSVSHRLGTIVVEHFTSRRYMPRKEN